MRRIFLLSLMAIAAGGTAAAADETSSSVLDRAIVSARAISTDAVAPFVPGFAVAATVDGRLVWSEGFGWADVATKKSVVPETRFRIGSTSKPLTSVGLALLVERGAVDLDLPVQTYIPDYPQKSGVITTRLLAGHLAGIRNYRGFEALSNRPYPDLRSALKIFENDPLESQPGSRYSYSSYNWNVIGVVMERASKQEFTTYMAEKVFGPLAMKSTVPDRAGVHDPLNATFYESSLMGAFVVAPVVDSSYKWPSGGFLSTAPDLVSFGSALLRPGFLTEKSLQLLFTSQKTDAGKLTHYGVGWTVDETGAHHSGDSVGGSSVLVIRRASRVVVAIVCNRGHLAVADASGRLVVRTASEGFTSSVLLHAAQRIAQAFASVSPSGPMSIDSTVGPAQETNTKPPTERVPD